MSHIRPNPSCPRCAIPMERLEGGMLRCGIPCRERSPLSWELVKTRYALDPSALHRNSPSRTATGSFGNAAARAPG